MEALKHMKQNLISCVQSQMSNLKDADSKELGEAIDMIKDLEEAIYYATITKAMHEGNDANKEDKYRRQEHYYPSYYRDMDRMYYPGPNYTMYYPNDSYGYQDGGRGSMNYPVEIRDYREGKSPIMRKSYMESKELHKDTKIKMQELDAYMQELTHDLVEMIEGATPEEKQLLQQKLTTLATKVK